MARARERASGGRAGEHSGGHATRGRSTAGRCRNCGRPHANCTCRHKPGARAPLGDGIVRIRRELKGRRGKIVTTISGLPMSGEDLAELARELKRLCGTGGSVKAGVVEIQGDHREALVEVLVDRGHRAVLADGPARP